MQQVLFAGHQNQVMEYAQEPAYEVLNLREGDVLFREGEPPRGLYFVQSGCLKVVVNRRFSRGRTATPEYVNKLVPPGEYFGYKALVRGGPSRASAVAVKKSTVWLYPREAILASLKSVNPLVRAMLQQSVSDLEGYESTNQLHYLASVQERIAHQLVLLANKFGVSTPNGVSLNLRLTRNEFAQLASTINESLSRHLTEFKNEGLIELNGKEILIKDLEGLRKKSGDPKGEEIADADAPVYNA